VIVIAPAGEQDNGKQLAQDPSEGKRKEDTRKPQREDEEKDSITPRIKTKTKKKEKKKDGAQ